MLSPRTRSANSTGIRKQSRMASSASRSRMSSPTRSCRQLSSRATSHLTTSCSGRVYRPKYTKMPDSKSSIDRLSIFLERVADESGDNFCAATQKATAKLSRIFFRLMEYAFTMDSRFAQTFEYPHNLTIKDGSLEHITSSEYKCRLYLKRIYHPSSCVMISGSRSGLPHGHVLIKKNKLLTSEEQTILKEQCRYTLDRGGYISPKKLQAWVTPVMMAAARDLIEWDEAHTPDFNSQHGFRDFAGVSVERTSTNMVKLIIPCNKDETVPYRDRYEDSGPRMSILTLVFVPTLKTHWNWPIGTQLQHAYPKTPPYGRNGQIYVKTIEEWHDDGGSLYLLEPSCTDIVMNHPINRPAYIGRTWAVITSCILWTMKRKLIHVRNLADFVLKVLDSLRTVAEQRFCPNFLMPNVNILKDLRIEDSKRISFDIAILQSRMVNEPSKILTYIGYYQN